MDGSAGSSTDPPKLRIVDPFEEDNDVMIRRLVDGAFNSVSNGKNEINFMQASTGLEFVFKRLQPVCPLPDRPWYNAVFRNYDVDHDGQIDKEAFEDIVKQYHAHHYEKMLKRSRRRATNSAPEGNRPSGDSLLTAPSSVQRPRTKSAGTASDKSVQLASHIMFPAHHGLCEVFKDYKFGDIAGKGSFGKVQIVVNKKTGAQRACKTIAIQAPEQWVLIKSEVELLKALNHPNIMKLFETYQDGYTIYLIIELCKGGPLFDRIVKHYEKLRKPITEDQVCDWMRQILSACAYCHERGVVHRDLKPENILFVDVQENAPLKIIDFGLSGTMQRLRETAREVKEKRTGVSASFAKLLPAINGRHIIPWYVRRVRMQRAGTPHYMAPEMIKGQYDEKVDIFAVGIIMYQLLSGFHPFYVPGVDNEQSVKHKILNDEPTFSGDEWQCVSPQAKDLCRKLLLKNPKKRISAKEALAHTWFSMMNTRGTGASQLTPSVFEGLKDWQSQNRLKQAVLQLLAKELNETDIMELRKKFEALDRQGLGTITFEQLKQSMRDAGYTVLESELAQIFDSIDAERQGMIGYNEFISTLLARRMTLKEEQLREIFNKFDTAGEGKLTVDTLRTALKGSKYGGLDDKELQAIFDEIDKNGDGYVDFYEFCDLMCANG